MFHLHTVYHVTSTAEHPATCGAISEDIYEPVRELEVMLNEIDGILQFRDAGLISHAFLTLPGIVVCTT